MSPEALAALLDGRLSGEERDAVLRRLASSPDDFEAFAEAARVLRDLEADAAAPPARPAAPPPPEAPFRRRRFPPVKAWLPLAAILAGAVLIPPLLSDRGGAGGPLDLLDGASLVASPGDGSLAAALGPDWDQPGWSVTRGNGGARGDERQEFRAGVRMADVEAAFDARDAQAVRRVRPELVGLLRRLGVSSLTVQEYEAIAPGSGPDRENDRARVASRVAESLERSPWFALGVWVEQARLAALANNTGHFDERAAELLDELTTRVAQERGQDAPLVGRLRQLHGIVHDGASPDELRSMSVVLGEVMRQSG